MNTMSSRNQNPLVVASLAAAGTGLAAVSGWFDGLIVHKQDSSNGEGRVAQVVHDSRTSLREILEEHQRRQTLVSRFVSPKLCKEYHDQASFFGFTLKDALRAGLLEKEAINSNIGFVVGDGEVYTLFPKILDPLIEFLHGVHPKLEYTSSIGNKNVDCENLDPRYVLSCRVRVLRSLRGFPFAWKCSEKERKEIEETAVEILGRIPGYEPSAYVKLSTLDTKTRDRFLRKNNIFYPYINESDQIWPSGRGVWYGDGDHAGVVVLINEQEHFKFISQQTGCDIKSTFNKIRHVVNLMEKFLLENAHVFNFDEDYGHLTSSPRETGTGLRISMNVKLPRLSQEPRFAFILRLLAFEKRQPGITSGHGIMELSNSTRTAQTEVDFIKHVVSGIHQLIAMEKLLENSQLIDPILCTIIKVNINYLINQHN